MSRSRLYFLFLTIPILCICSLSQGQTNYFDNFDSYVPGQPLACQNPIDWTTWNLTPCGFEDPYISMNQAISGTNSVVILQYKDLIKPLGNIITGLREIYFQVYIPDTKVGYFNILSGFSPDPYEWGMECFFDIDGTVRIFAGSVNPINFSYTHDTWHLINLRISLIADIAEFWFNGNLIHSWQWSLGAHGGGSALKLAANNFYGYYANNELYIDDYLLSTGCLSCTPPTAPGNLSAQVIFDPAPNVELNWTDNSQDEYNFKIIRKQGFPVDPAEYESIGTVSSNVTHFIDNNVLLDSIYTYGVIAYNLYGFSDTSNTATIMVEPIPVEFITFSYEIIPEGGISLYWQTASEINNKGFEIEKKTGKYQLAINWQTIAFVEGFGTTTEIQEYFYIDKDIKANSYSYRLKQIDFDGTFVYSEIIETNIPSLTEFTLRQNYPNPFNPSTRIEFNLPEDGFVTLKIYNVLGREITALVEGYRNKGVNNIEFTANNLSAGIYFYEIKVNEFTARRKMILMK